jgi:hypothetical protein
MAKDLMDYNSLVEDALKGVVRQALERVAAQGLPGQHHFYLAFRTDDPATEISEALRSQYPEEMTIVLQHQYWGLAVGEDGFEVTLTFNKVPERLVIPFRALTRFDDPSVPFRLHFQSGAVGAAAEPPARLEDLEPPAAEPAPEEGGVDGGEEEGDNVVPLDQFRKK